MFKVMRNIDSAFRHIKTFSIVLIIANVLMFGFYVYRSDQRVARAENKVLIGFEDLGRTSPYCDHDFND